MNEAGRWVVDASIAAKWYLRDEDHVAPALALLRSYQHGNTALAAPHFIRYEIARSLLRAEQERRINEGQAASQLQRFLDLDLHMPDDPDTRLLAAQVLCRSLRVGFYDALSLA